MAFWSDFGGSYRLEHGGVGRSQVFASGLPLELERGIPLLPTSARSGSLGAVRKRAFDLTVSAMALVFLAPLLLGLAAAVKLSGPGPVLFRQQRHGLNGKPFSIYKFRTMRVEDADPTGVRQACAGDPAVTRVGRFMRATSLDELPQLLNIVKGDMSIIGPRPHAIGMLAAGVPYETLVPYYHRRHAVMPGLSGWAQVNGLRGPTVDPAMARDRIDHDLAYIQNQSLMLDVKIIVMTIRREFLTGTGL